MSTTAQLPTGLLPLYLERVPTTDAMVKLWPKTKAFDVVARRDPNGPICARWLWYYESKPRKSSRLVIMNCYYWKAVWLPKEGGK